MMKLCLMTDDDAMMDDYELWYNLFFVNPIIQQTDIANSVSAF